VTLLAARPIPTPLNLDAFNFDHIADALTPHPTGSPELSKFGKIAFARAWKRFACDFTNELWATEYNSIKHGMRVNPGGMTLAFRLASEKDKPYRTLGGSEFGSQFFARQSLHGRIHVRGRRHVVNWNPLSLGQRIQAIGASITNLRGMLLGFLGEDIYAYEFVVPDSEEAFDGCWGDDPRVMNISFDSNIGEEDIDKFSKPEIEQRLKKLWKGIPID
jgi:hypothetical protein